MFKKKINVRIYLKKGKNRNNLINLVYNIFA